MTRYLSQSLGAAEPRFGQSIEELERAGGRPSADIRLTAEIIQKSRQKLAGLGLDPADTTGPELYAALHERLRQDEAKIRRALSIAEDAAPGAVLSRIQQCLAKHDMPKSCFTLKSAVAKKLLKKKVPKTTMKALGYRSIDSMLKHEPAAQIYALAFMAEPASWQKAFRAQYAKLQPGDFEAREIALLCPQSKRWLEAASQYVARARHNIACFQELGAVVILPLDHAVDGLALTTLLLVLHYYNDIRAYSSFIKLQQVRTDFGARIAKTAGGEPYTSVQVGGQPVSWRMIQRYYGRFAHAFHPEVFEPHVQPEDLAWCDAEDALARIEPALAFWQGTAGLCVLHDGQPVSMNMLDVALGYCNHLPFAERIVHFVRDRIWHELMMRYLNQENLEAAVAMQLSNELVDSQTLAETQ